MAKIFYNGNREELIRHAMMYGETLEEGLQFLKDQGDLYKQQLINSLDKNKGDPTYKL